MTKEMNHAGNSPWGHSIYIKTHPVGVTDKLVFYFAKFIHASKQGVCGENHQPSLYAPTADTW